ncbi:MAG: 6-O-methylguanine DNA methyltransferase [Verrucomicrobia bacterium]|nr:MAG: 6-O-methylguanine DNA methyltransferase [Verrucomicrobiota bacterium]
MNDYERIATVIRYLDRHHANQPDLNALAQCVGLSPFHFHRLFSNWAGVTPKDFLQCLTLEHVKTLLREGDTVLGAALNAGLSGPGRLHDLCVTLEAASPGEMKSGGAGLQIEYGFAETPFGEALIAETARGLCHLSFVNGEGRNDARELLATDWSNAKLRRTDERARELSQKIFAPSAANKSRPHLRAFVRGTPFQLRVWRALLRVPAGAAVGANPLAFIIPCHRVIRETGVLGNYRWDPIRKRAMLGWERASSFNSVDADRVHAAA